jgi:hypothetical protein
LGGTHLCAIVYVYFVTHSVSEGAPP